MKIRFGTDGWRALVAEEFTLPNVRAVTQGVAEYLLAHPDRSRPRSVIVGYDTRPLGDRFAEAAAEVFAGNGFRVLVTESPMPTPAISFAIRELNLQGGIVVTASHNPFTYNGLKFKPFYAGPSEPEMTHWIEGRLFRGDIRRIPFEKALAGGKIRFIDLAPRYLNFLRRYVDWPIVKKARFRVAYDSMHGAGQDLLQRVVAGSRLEIIPVPHGPGPVKSRHRPEPIGEHLKELSRTVRSRRCDVGLATDGDADRLGVVGPDGKFISSQETMGLLLWHLLEDRGWWGMVVSTISASNLLDAITAHYGVPFRRTPVGFKHIARYMRTEDVLFGGEESGGFGFRGCVPERDGLLAGLLILEMMVMRKKNLGVILKKMRSRFGRWFFQRADLMLEKPMPMERLLGWAKKSRNSFRGRIETADGVKVTLQDKSWFLLRPSGTEPLLRVYVEGKSQAQVKKLLAAGQKIGREIVAR